MKTKKTPNTKKKPLNTYARYSSIALQMAIIIAIGTFVGVTLDEKYPNSYKLYTVIFTLSAVILSIIYVIKRIIAIANDGN